LFWHQSPTSEWEAVSKKLITVEVVGHLYLRVLALEEANGQLQVENSILQEKVIKLTPATPGGTPPVHVVKLPNVPEGEEENNLPDPKNVIT
jgi:hypothetical protein